MDCLPGHVTDAKGLRMPVIPSGNTTLLQTLESAYRNQWINLQTPANVIKHPCHGSGAGVGGLGGCSLESIPWDGDSMWEVS